MHKYSRSMRPTPMASRAHLPRRKWWFVLLALCGLVLAGGIGPLPSAAKPLPPAVSPLPAQPADLREGNWTNLYPGLRAVSAAAASDAWAGGEYGRLLHFTGGAWTVVDPPVLRGHDITDLRMLADGSGWLAADGLAYRYSNGTWQAQNAGLGGGAALAVTRLAPVAAGDVWAIGAVTTPAGARATFLHWDGQTWSAAGSPLDESVGLYDIAMASATEGWAAGTSSSQVGPIVVVRHYDGQSWTPVVPPNLTFAALNTVAIAGPGDIWFGGTDGHGGSVLLHDSGGTWTTMAPSDNGRPAGFYFAAPNDGWLATDHAVLHWDGAAWSEEYGGSALSSVAGAGSAVWAVGPADTVLQRSATGPTVAWLPQRGGPTTHTLNAVSAPSAGEAWAVGDQGTVVHYSGGHWTPEVAPSSVSLFGVDVLPSGEGWAAGFSSFGSANDSSIVRRGTGGLWTPVPVPTHNWLWAVRMRSPTDGYAAGDRTILHWDGGAWTQVATPPAEIHALAVVGPGDAWAVGTEGAIWHATGGVWAEVPSPTTEFLDAVLFDSPTHGWAGGGRYTDSGFVPVLLEYTVGHWVDRTSSLPARPSSVSGLAAEALGEAWSVGCGAAYHYAGGAWQAQAMPTHACQNALALVPGRGGWAVGAAGQILRYNPLAPGQRFYDVPLNQTFYTYIEYMAAHGIVAGYSDNTFRPANNITRDQLTKLVALGMAWTPVAPTTPTFADVPASHPFYTFVETAAAHSAVSGYTCGGPGEPCDGAHRPYFRAQSDVTRSQITKILVTARGWTPLTPAQPTFADVPAAHPFFGYVERAVEQGIISGYSCGGPGEPCPGRYFRPANSATRGQLSKVLYLALTAP